MFTDSEKQFLNAHSLCRFASISPDAWPHNVPVGYTFDGEYFYISTEYTTKKLRNVRRNRRASLVVDEPGTKATRKAVMIQAEADVLESGPEFQIALQKIVSQRGEKWGFKEGDQAILKVRPVRKVSWNL